MSEKERKEDETVEEEQTEEEQEKGMETVHASASEVVAKPTDDVKKLADKAIASKLSEEEQRKAIEDNLIGEFYD